MQSVKTYQQVNSENENMSFEIAKMEDFYIRREGRVDDPHRHNYYTVLIVKKAKGEHKIDFKGYPLGHNQIYFVAPGQVHQMIEKEKSHGYVLTFSNHFLVKNNIQISFIDSLSLFQSYGQSPPLLPDENRFKRIEKFAQEIFILHHGIEKLKEYAIGAYLKLLLIECNNICQTHPSELIQDNNGSQLIKDFKATVDTFYKQEHSTSFYAAQLHISPDHLNRVIKANIGKTAKEYIQARIITEAKRLLFFTDLTSKEIGFELGFKEPANFSAFFKKCTTVSPSLFKKNEVSL